jgi:hypothetical protein
MIRNLGFHVENIADKIEEKIEKITGNQRNHKIICLSGSTAIFFALVIIGSTLVSLGLPFSIGGSVLLTVGLLGFVATVAVCSVIASKQRQERLTNARTS